MAAYNLLVWLQPAIYSVSYRSICTSRQNVSPLQNSLQDCVTSKHLYIFPQFFNNRRVSLMLGHWMAIYPVDSAIVHLAQLVVQKLESAVHQICTLLVSLIVIPQIVIYPRGSTIPRLNNQGQLNIWGLSGVTQRDANFPVEEYSTKAETRSSLMQRQVVKILTQDLCEQFSRQTDS